MFDIWSFRGIDAVVSSGLGGGSLIYANVLLRKDERWFRQPVPGGQPGEEEDWPVTRADLDPHYDRVEQMLRAQTLPFDEPGYDLQKTAALRDAAAGLGQEWGLVPLAVRFRNDGQPAVPEQALEPNRTATSTACPGAPAGLCGECDIGCNTVPRTPSTTPTCRRPLTGAP